MKHSASLLVLAALALPCSAETLTLKCTYLSMAQPSGFKKLAEPFILTFVMDLETKAAYIVGNAGSNPVQVQRGAEGFMIVERTKSGTLQVTAIDDAMHSAHSRHTIAGKGGLIPSQYYGACVAS